MERARSLETTRPSDGGRLPAGKDDSIMGDFERVKEAVNLKEYAAAHLEPARGGHVCPVCDSGTGPNKTPAFSVKGDKWKCFSCDAGGDVFDLAGAIHRTEDKAEQLRHVAAWARIDLEGGASGSSGGFNARYTGAGSAADEPAESTADRTAENTADADKYAEGRAKHRQYVAECARRLADEPTADLLAYLEQRGITHAEAVALGLGYDPKPAHGWQDEAGNWHNGPRLVIPWAGSDFYHIDRAMDGRAHNLKYDKPPSKPDEKTPISECVGPQPTWNPAAFSEPYLVAVEGALDALAIQLCGYNAVALGGTSVNNFATEAAAHRYAGVVIDMMDADGDMEDENEGNRKGRGAGAKLCDLLGNAGILTLSRAEYGIGTADLYSGQYKDAGEMLAANRADLAQMLEYMRLMAKDKAEAAKNDEWREAMKNLKLEDAGEIARGIYNCADEETPVSTGFTSLDRALDGGLRSGLMILGAVSSAGKTTFLSQVADYIAAHGRPVLFVSIEQSGRELVSKSISRMMAGRGYDRITLHEMGAEKYRAYWPEEKTRALAEAVGEYAAEVAPNLHIMAACEQPSINDVKAAAYRIADKCGQPPVIMLDYLQILKPLNERDTERQAVDGNISELRRLSGANGLRTPVLVISSFNRGSYSGAIEMESFKESGGVEYGSDVLAGIQPYRMEQQVTARTKDDKPPTEQVMKFRAREIVKAFRKQDVKDAELVILKNRNGALPKEPLRFTFHAASSLFVEG